MNPGTSQRPMQEASARYHSLPTFLILGSGAGAKVARRRGCYDMVMNAQLSRISVNPKVCFGKPCIKGTRIWVSLVLDMLADGTTEQELLKHYPQLTHEDVLAAIAYGAEVSRERIVPVPTEAP